MLLVTELIGNRTERINVNIKSDAVDPPLVGRRAPRSLVDY